MSVSQHGVRIAPAIIVGFLLCLSGAASAQTGGREASRDAQSPDVQQASIALPSLAQACLQAPAATGAVRIERCSQAISSGALGGHDLAMAYLARAGAYTAGNDTARAADDNRQAVLTLTASMDPEQSDPELLFLRGTAYHALGQADLALADYDLAIRLSPLSPIAFIDRGILLTAYKQQYALAIMDFDRALALSPDNRAALLHRADAYARSGDAKRALADYDRVLVLAPQNAEALAGRVALQSHSSND